MPRFLDRRYDKKIFVCIGRYFLITAILLGGMTYSGFCFKELRYISDEEKIRIAIAYILKENRENVVPYKDNSFLYPYKDVDDFLVSNPSCCQIWDGIGGDTYWLEKLFGKFAGCVYAEYLGTHKKTSKTKSLIVITNCGKPWDALD
jgi:hypothetical protein